MEKEIDFEEILSRYRSDPYGYVDVFALHTGMIYFKVSKGDTVEGQSGQWQHLPGTLLYELQRERNPKKVHSRANGVVSFLRQDLEGQFVEAAEKVMTIRHPLKKKEIVDNILRNVLFTFRAPERAKYFFSLDVQAKIDKFGQRSVIVRPGEDLFIMSLMKRDTAVIYDGEEGIIHSIYFQSGESVEQGDPLIGICPPALLPMVEKIIGKVNAEWEEPDNSHCAAHSSNH